MLDTVKSVRVNGLDLKALGDVVEAIEKDAGQAKAAFEVTTRWAGQTRSESVVEGFTLGGERVSRTHEIVADEPFELLGLSDTVPPGYEEIEYQVRIKGDGSREQFEEIHQTVLKTSPNYFNISRP